MTVELTHQIRLPYSNDYLAAGTKLVVEDIRGIWYLCRTDDAFLVCIHKNDCKEIKNND